MDTRKLQQAFLTFLAHLGETFDRASTSDDSTFRDFLGFGAVQLHVTSDDLATIQARLGELLSPYLTADGGERRTVTLATALIPEP